MTAPVPADQEESLREEIARFLWTARYGSLPSASWDQAVEIAEDIPDGRAAGSLREMRMQADRLLAGPLATLRAKVDQLASELREARGQTEALRMGLRLAAEMRENGREAERRYAEWRWNNPIVRAALSDPRPSPAKGDVHHG